MKIFHLRDHSGHNRTYQAEFDIDGNITVKFGSVTIAKPTEQLYAAATHALQQSHAVEIVEVIDYDD